MDLHEALISLHLFTLQHFTGLPSNALNEYLLQLTFFIVSMFQSSLTVIVVDQRVTINGKRGKLKFHRFRYLISLRRFLYRTSKIGTQERFRPSLRLREHTTALKVRLDVAANEGW